MPYQDLLKLGSEYRINQPSTVKEQNWAVRLKKSDFSKKAIETLKKLTKNSNRI
jgi:4-alpha-glucanotransferase